MKRRTLSLIISGLLGVIAILSGIYLMAASVTNYIAESKKTDWIVTEARYGDGSGLYNCHRSVHGRGKY